MMLTMTQLFDTTGFDHEEAPGRHLRSIGDSNGGVDAPTPVSWRLDDQTIAVGRQGIQRAREALRVAAAARSAASQPAGPDTDSDTGHRRAA